jgi:hypothetical protein
MIFQLSGFLCVSIWNLRWQSPQTVRGKWIFVPETTNLTVSGTNIHFPLTVCGDCHLRFQIDTQRKPDNWKIIIPKEYSKQIMILLKQFFYVKQKSKMVATAGQSFDISLYGKMNKYFFSEIRNLMKSNSTWIIIEIQIYLIFELITKA